ncbi:efflux RND transporter periplasmic adaptor subunit [Balneolaceae bacterium ANBcel3]|nr:efflux RND transporter periplasmic adaptor subunit [Balneolaceae bacterium ANBcel3]
MNIDKKQMAIAIGILIAGILLGGLLFSGSGSGSHDTHEPSDSVHNHDHSGESASENEVWTCSMHPSVRQDGPGSCPICGMDLIPAASEEREDDYTMVMTESAIQLANVQTTPVIRDVPFRELHLPGRLRVDERRITRVTAYFPGRIITTKVNFTGAPIRKGEPMATIYSPELLTAQRELLESARQKERNPRLYESARTKFELWGFSDRQIDDLVEQGEVQRELEILAPVDGVVLQRNVTDQQYVSEGTVMFEVADLSRLWLVLEAYEEDLNWVSVGDSIHFKLRGETFSNHKSGNGSMAGDRHAVVHFIDPVVHPQRRTAGIRADIDNAGGLLKPDMLATGTLRAQMSGPKLMVPVTSVLWTGPRSLVYVRDFDADVPTFRVREVTLGPRAGDFYVIEDGLEEGEEVVFNGAFRIDSEFQLADRFSMMNREPGTGAVPVHDHGERDDHDRHEDSSAHEMDGHEDPFDDVPGEFRSQFTTAIDAYSRGKDALVDSDLDGAQEEFAEFRSRLESIGEHGLPGSGHESWMMSFTELHEQAGRIVNAGELEEARNAFRALSDELIRAVKLFGADGVVYHQYCPMAFDDEGGHWLSRESGIRNPYLPETMLMCGEIRNRFGE